MPLGAPRRQKSRAEEDASATDERRANTHLVHKHDNNWNTESRASCNERANTHLGNKHDKNWKHGANAHLSELHVIHVELTHSLSPPNSSSCFLWSECRPENKQNTEHEITREIKELLQLPFLSLVYLATSNNESVPNYIVSYR